VDRRGDGKRATPRHGLDSWRRVDVFGNFPKSPTARDEAVSALMRQYWINFSAHGNPNGPGLPVWKAFDEVSQSAMVFGYSSHSQRLPNIEGLKALDDLLRCAKPRDKSADTS
jgi:hypothetical protein